LDSVCFGLPLLFCIPPQKLQLSPHHQLLDLNRTFNYPATVKVQDPSRSIKIHQDPVKVQDPSRQSCHTTGFRHITSTLLLSHNHVTPVMPLPSHYRLPSHHFHTAPVTQSCHSRHATPVTLQASVASLPHCSCHTIMPLPSCHSHHTTGFRRITSTLFLSHNHATLVTLQAPVTSLPHCSCHTIMPLMSYCSHVPLM